MDAGPSRKPCKEVGLPPGKGVGSRLLHRTPKSVASRYYQLLTGHAAIGPYLKGRTHRATDDRCWWRGGRKQQTRYHLFMECTAWLPQTRRMWKAIGKAHGWKYPRAPATRGKKGGRPPRICNLLSFLFIPFGYLALPFVWRSGEKEKRVPCYDRQSRSEPGESYVKSRRCPLGSCKLLPQPFGPHIAVNK